MPFRVLYAFTFIFLTLNIGLVLRISGANAIEKGLFVVTTLVMLATRRQDPVVLVLMVCEFILVFTLAFLTKNDAFSWSVFLNSLNQISVLFILLSSATYPRDQLFVWRLAAGLPLLCAALGVVYHFGGIGRMVSVEFATGVPRYNGSMSSAAFTSAMAMCGVYAATKLMLAQNRAYMVLLLVNLMILLAAGGRKALAVAILVSGAALFLSKSVRFGDKLMIAGAGLVAGLAMLAVVWENLVTRLLESGDSGRTVMWDYLREVIAQYPDFGIGFGHQFFTTPRHISVMVGSPSAHNDYLRLAVELGTVGMYIFYALLTAAVVRACFRYGYRSIEGVLVYGGFLFLSNTDNALAAPLAFPLIFLGILSVHDSRRTNEVSSARPASMSMLRNYAR